MGKQESYSEQELLAKLKLGEIEAFEGLYRAYSQRLYHFGLRYLKSVTEAEGLVQNVFEKVWERRETIRGDLNFKSYIFTIAFNFIRKNFNKKSRLREYLQSKDGSYDIDFSTSQQIDFQSYLNYLHTLVQQLPEKRREIFIKVKLEDRAIKDVANQMGISPKTVENQLGAAAKFIKDNWKPEGLSALLFFYLVLTS